MDSALEAKLIECLGALESGASLEQALSRFPEDAERLRPMLAVAAALPALRLEPSQEVKAKSRQAFLARAASVSGMAGSRRTLLARPLAAFASLAIALVIVGGVAVTASASALPGDPLYGVKRTVENALLSISSDPATLAAQFERERVDEVVALLAAGREAEVEFSGVIESIQPNVWVVSGVPVAITFKEPAPLSGPWIVRPERSLGAVADFTGGVLITEVPHLRSKPELVLSTILARVRLAYRLGFAPVAHDGRLHRVDVRVKGEGLTVRARKGYVDRR